MPVPAEFRAAHPRAGFRRHEDSGPDGLDHGHLGHGSEPRFGYAGGAGRAGGADRRDAEQGI